MILQPEGVGVVQANRRLSKCLCRRALFVLRIFGSLLRGMFMSEGEICGLKSVVRQRYRLEFNTDLSVSESHPRMDWAPFHCGLAFPVFIGFLLMLSSLPAQSNKLIAFGQYNRAEFSPVRGQEFTIPFELQEQARVTLEIYGTDGERVRVLAKNQWFKRGRHEIKWNGKDDEGRNVPDEAWIPVLYATGADGTTTVDDPREYSGGEVIEDIGLKRNDEQSYSYRLPASARVSIRAGIKGGPLLNVLADWEPHAPGKNILYWNGRDADGLVDLRETGRLKLVASAFRLPESSIITTGNQNMDYRVYRKLNGWPLPRTDLSAVKLQRGERRISRSYYLPVLKRRQPVLKVSIRGEREASSGIPVIRNRAWISVDLDAESKLLLRESRYEVGFFIDNEFISEEEQGYMPLKWQWKPNDIEPGVHVLTVNVNAFHGQVGVKSVEFVVESPAPEK